MSGAQIRGGGAMTVRKVGKGSECRGGDVDEATNKCVEGRWQARTIVPGTRVMRGGAGTEREGEEARGTTVTTRRSLFAPSPASTGRRRSGKGKGEMWGEQRRRRSTGTTTAADVASMTGNDARRRRWDDCATSCWSVPPLRSSHCGGRRICQGTAPVSVPMTLVFLGLFFTYIKN